ncbi:MAG TPA: aminotransferase class V-fold PLP-dependent enzyme [Myxococcaceae bacterium]|nr:aminotransferase class V-fold PLP-dependent enzyme [Myxococcaceae bacterium]
MANDPLLEWRSEFPILQRKRGYLINNSLGAMPRKVYDNLQAFADAWATEGVLAWHDWLPRVTQTADLLGAILNAPQGTVMMHQNVSTLTSLLISGLEFAAKKNQVVLTELNFPSVVYNWLAQERRGAKVVAVPSRDGGLNVETEDLVRAIDGRTIAVALDLVLFRSSGLIDPRPVIERAQRHGAVVILDCYQAIGTVPVDVQALGVDFVIGGSVKWLCGGPGAAYLYARKDWISRFEPLMTGWFSDKKPFDFRFGPIDYADDIHRFMGGSPSVPALYAARAGYEIIREVGVKAIREKSLRQTALLVSQADEQGLRVNTPRAPERRGGTVCVDFEGSEDCSRRLIERGFIIDWRPRGGIRISPHFYNSDDECRAIMEEIRQLRASGSLQMEPSGQRLH